MQRILDIANMQRILDIAYIKIKYSKHSIQIANAALLLEVNWQLLYFGE